VKLNIEDSKLHIKLNPLEMLFGHRGSFTIPLSNVASASTEKPGREWKQVRAPGTYVPFVIRAGTYYGRQSKEFWQTTVGRPSLTIELRDWDYDRIVLTLSNARAWAERINQAQDTKPTTG
jgi:hypothetical protein